ncbi:MAG: hypothetical protein AAGE65_07100 [Planctomycetota bacterium]
MLYGSLAASWAWAGCTAPPIKPDLSSDRAAARVPALVEQARLGDDADFASLIRALDDHDPAVRFAAARSLHTLTGQDLGYRFFDPRLERQDAVARWQDWLIRRQTALPDESEQVSLRSAHRPAPSSEAKARP